jgi:hypothetical protein
VDAVVCQRCFSALPEPGGEEIRCTQCGAHARLMIYPALLRPPDRGRVGETLMIDGQSSCFYHPEKAASVPCETCGRFLCTLCDIELGDRHVCPGCLGSDESGARSGLDAQRSLPDTIALDLSLIPLIPIFWWAILFTAPMVLFLCIQYWNAETSLIRRGRWRLILALLISGSELVVIVTFFFFILLGTLA